MKAKPTAIVGTVEAKAKLSTLLERVARGEHIVITRHGKPIARLMPIATAREGKVSEAMAKLRKLREAWRPIVEGIARRGSQVTEATKVIDTPIDSEGDIASRAWTDTLLLARAERLTLYDAVYLELAIRRDVELATLDRELRRAAKKIGVAVVP